MKLSKKRIAIFTFIHLGVLFASFIISFSAGMDEFDGKREITAFEKMLQKFTVVLMSPVYLLWNSWASKNIHDAIEFVLFVFNSILWGIAAEYIYLKYKSKTMTT